MLTIAKSNTRAFSLVELLCSLGIISMLLLMSLPSIARVNTSVISSGELESLLNNLRIKSQLLKLPVTLRFTPGTRQIIVSPAEVFSQQTITLPGNSKIEEARFGNLTSEPYDLIYYPGRSATPGSAFIRWDKNRHCLLNQTLRGETTIKCQ